MDIEVFNGIDEPYGDFDSDMNFGSDYNYFEGDTLSELADSNPLVISALRSAEISHLPPPGEIIDVSGFDNSAVANTENLNLYDDVRIGDSERAMRQELEYGSGGSLPEALHEDAHRLPRSKAIRTQYGPQTEEVICDIRSGMLSGHVSVPRGAFRNEIGPTKGGASHPDGCDRVPYFEEAYDLAANDPFKDFIHPDKNIFLREKIRDLESKAVRQFGSFNLYA